MLNWTPISQELVLKLLFFFVAISEKIGYSLPSLSPNFTFPPQSQLVNLLASLWTPSDSGQCPYALQAVSRVFKGIFESFPTSTSVFSHQTVSQSSFKFQI